MHGKAYVAGASPDQSRVLKRVWKRYVRRSGRKEVKDQLEQQAQPEYIDPTIEENERLMNEHYEDQCLGGDEADFECYDSYDDYSEVGYDPYTGGQEVDDYPFDPMDWD